MSVTKKYPPKHKAEGPPQKQPVDTKEEDDDCDDEHEHEHEHEHEEPELTDTVFIRNIARFDTTQESLKEYIEKNFGETVYCLICKDRETGESKGTAFVKFKSVETAEKCLEEYEDPEHQTKFFLDGRNLFVLPALSRNKIDEVRRATAPRQAENEGGAKKKKKKPRHNRARPPISQVANSSSKSGPPESKSFQDRKSQNNTDKHNVPFRKNKDKQTKGNKQSNNKPSKQNVIRLPPRRMQGGKKVKKDQKKKVLAKQNTKKKPRGRH